MLRAARRAVLDMRTPASMSRERRAERNPVVTSDALHDQRETMHLKL